MRVEDVGDRRPKVVDWDEPRLLRDVGRSADRFGHPYSPLKPGRSTRASSTGCSRCSACRRARCWSRARRGSASGCPTNDSTRAHEDLDFCWRARLAGFHVLMTPLARARHRDASATGERPDDPSPSQRAVLRGARGPRGDAQELRPALAAVDVAVGRSLLGLVALLLPDADPAVRGRDRSPGGVGMEHRPPARDALRAACAHSPSGAFPIASCAGSWNPPASGSPRWFAAAGQIFEEQREIDEQDEDEPVRPAAARSNGFAGRFAPVLVASLLGDASCAGGGVPRLLGPGVAARRRVGAFPGSWRGFFARAGVGVPDDRARAAPVAASPASGRWAGCRGSRSGAPRSRRRCSWRADRSSAAVMLYRALARITGRPGAAVVGASAYGLVGAGAVGVL